jgi:4-hydroxy-2-oxoheptanedioate aldolase
MVLDGTTLAFHDPTQNNGFNMSQQTVLNISPRERLRAKLAGRQLVMGVICSFPSADAVEFLGGLDFDFVLIDCEHGGPDFGGVIEMARAARAARYASLLRPWSTEPGLMRRFVDCGIDGILAPGLESASQVRTLSTVIAAADPPEAASFILGGLIETTAACAALPDICAAGLDLAMLGPSDLAVSLGYPRRADTAEVTNMILKAVETAHALNMSVGAPASRFGPELLLSKGANILVYSLVELIKDGAGLHQARVKAAAAETRPC